MAAGGITRRSLLAAGAGALAGRLAWPRLAWPAPAATPVIAAAPPRIGALALGDVSASERTLALPAAADLVALQWRGSAGALPQLRVRARGGRWSRWVPGAGCGAEAPSAAGSLIGAPVWVAGARELQLRAAQPLHDVRLHLVSASASAGDSALALAPGRHASGLAAADAQMALASDLALGQPPIIARRVWAQGVCHPSVAPGYGAVRMAFVHHTETPNGYLPAEVAPMLRAIFAFHRFVRGWNDIGYNFVIDAFGRIFEARAGGTDEPVVGAQAGGYNQVSTGVAVLGSYGGQDPPAPALAALHALLAWKLSLHSVPALGRVRVEVNPAGAVYSRFPAGARVWLPHIAGHRDGDSTDCPGDALYADLPAVRRVVRQLAPQPARAALSLQGVAPGQVGVPPASAGQPVVSAQLTGSLALLDGTPIAGALLSLQLRSVSQRGEVVRERTVTQVRTDAQGRWSLPLTATGAAAAGKRWLRSAYDGRSGQPASGHAAVSEAVALPAPLRASLEALPPSAAT